MVHGASDHLQDRGVPTLGCRVALIWSAMSDLRALFRKVAFRTWHRGQEAIANAGSALPRTCAD